MEYTDCEKPDCTLLEAHHGGVIFDSVGEALFFKNVFGVMANALGEERPLTAELHEAIATIDRLTDASVNISQQLLVTGAEMGTTVPRMNSTISLRGNKIANLVEAAIDAVNSYSLIEDQLDQAELNTYLPVLELEEGEEPEETE